MRSLDNASAYLLLAGLLGAGAATAQATKSAMTCATCHPAQAIPQPGTSMAKALATEGQNEVLRSHEKLTAERGAYHYSVESNGPESTYIVSDGTNVISAPIRWAFGANSQTWVLERDGRLYESVVSYYESIKGLDTTLGDNELRPKTLPEAFGRELTATEAAACFSCHSTGAVSQNRLDLKEVKPGVRCDHCHAGANEHFQAVSKGKLESVPPRLKRLSSEEMANFCGQCHRSFETVVEMHLLGPANVRFQPYRLANSKCFDGSDARISCIACHDPHREVARDTKSYDPKCMACHNTAATPKLANVAGSNVRHDGAIAKICPVAKSDCASCHMPNTQLPGGHMIFSDHFIRVVRPGETYPN